MIESQNNTKRRKSVHETIPNHSSNGLALCPSIISSLITMQMNCNRQDMELDRCCSRFLINLLALLAFILHLTHKTSVCRERHI